MAVIKRVICPEQLRHVPPQFSWLDHRLVRDKRIVGRSLEALALYLFLVTVADGQGLSYYSDASISQLLPLQGPTLACARQELIRARLIAYQKPLYQVLSLDPPVPRSGKVQSLGQILRQTLNSPQFASPAQLPGDRRSNQAASPGPMELPT
ncbi:MAG: hypothetical protein ABII12_02220 [Planctomycetota bacterium]